MHNRRKLLVALGAAAIAAPLASLTRQPAKIRRIEYLSPFPSGNDQRFEIFKQQLRDLGYVDRIRLMRN